MLSSAVIGPYGLGDFGIGAIVLLFAIWCIYRIFKGEPQDRVVRWGVFIERQVAPRDGVISTPPSEQITDTHEWPPPS